MMRQASVTSAAWCDSAVAWRGLQRWQGRNPARSASSQLAWNSTFSGRGVRDAQLGRQYTPVVCTEYQNVPSAPALRATTAAQRGSAWVAVACAALVLGRRRVGMGVLRGRRVDTFIMVHGSQGGLQCHAL